MNTTASSALLNKSVALSDKYSKKIQNVCQLLMSITGLSKDICENMLSYLSSEDQYQFMIFNPFTIDNMYSIIQFILIFNNICHFLLILLIYIFEDTLILGPMYAILMISFAETVIIFYFYAHYYNIYISDISIETTLALTSLKTRKFTNKLDSMLHICIYTPLTCIILFVFNTNIDYNYTLILAMNIIYFSLYFTTTMYQCYMYHRHNIVEKELTAEICVLLYLQINAVILMIYSLIYSLLIFYILSLMIIHVLPHLFCYFGIFELSHIYYPLSENFGEESTLCCMA
eukprot:530410_1